MERAKQARADAVGNKEAKEARDAEPAQRWEYDTLWIREGLTEGVSGGGQLTAILDKHGDKGWELVQVVNDRALFKRPVD